MLCGMWQFNEILCEKSIDRLKDELIYGQERRVFLEIMYTVT